MQDTVKSSYLTTGFLANLIMCQDSSQSDKYQLCQKSDIQTWDTCIELVFHRFATTGICNYFSIHSKSLSQCFLMDAC